MGFELDLSRINEVTLTKNLPFKDGYGNWYVLVKFG